MFMAIKKLTSGKLCLNFMICSLEDRLKEFYPWFTRQNRNYELLYLGNANITSTLIRFQRSIGLSFWRCSVGGDTDAGIHCVTDHYNFVAVLLDLMQPTYRPDEPIQIRIRRKTSEFSTYYFNRDRMQELIDNNLAGFRLWQYINVYVHIQTDRGRQEWELERTNKRWLA